MDVFRNFERGFESPKSPFGTTLKRDKVTWEWRRLHDEELYDLYSSPNIIGVIISRRIKWVGRAACMARGTIHTGFWWRHLREKDHLEDQGYRWKNNIKMYHQRVG